MNNPPGRTKRAGSRGKRATIGAPSPHRRPSFDDSTARVVKDISDVKLPRAPAVRAMPSSLALLGELGYSDEEISSLVVPKRTLARRQAQNDPLSVEETDKALRLKRIATLAADVFGSADKANDWLRKPKRQLDGQTPLAFLSSEAGARIVEDMLRRIEHGILA